MNELRVDLDRAASSAGDAGLAELAGRLDGLRTRVRRRRAARRSGWALAAVGTAAAVVAVAALTGAHLGGTRPEPLPPAAPTTLGCPTELPDEAYADADFSLSVSSLFPFAAQTKVFAVVVSHRDAAVELTAPVEGRSYLVRDGRVVGVTGYQVLPAGPLEPGTNGVPNVPVPASAVWCADGPAFTGDIAVYSFAWLVLADGTHLVTTDPYVVDEETALP